MDSPDELINDTAINIDQPFCKRVRFEFTEEHEIVILFRDQGRTRMF